MPDVAYSLWAPEIKGSIQSPFAILEQQAEALTKQTDGVLVGEVRVVTARNHVHESTTSLHLEIVVPALDGLRHGVLVATHLTESIYPVTIDAVYFRRVSNSRKPGLFTALVGEEEKKPENQAASDQEFRQLVEKVLRSDEVKSVAQSLIARANEARELQRREKTKSETG